jgi:uncharacterized membrane protein AbrB (regulator of aidB expression)
VFILKRIDHFEKVPFADAIKAFLATCISLILGCCVMFVVGYSVLRLAGVHHLERHLAREDGIALITGILIGKTSRYLYWNSQ